MIDVTFERVSKRYRIRADDAAAGARPGLAGKLRNWFGPTQDFWAVRDLDFQIPTGQALGIIGRNGAGKSTVLKLLSHITTPTSGEITITGRISALLEVGSGFHPELTGRENVYLSGAILGMRRSEISRKLESIVEFAGVRAFIDVPVKRYSSGMYVRLGFSIAAHLEPDILLLDEVLAVGDVAFQQKCLERILELKQAGMTIVFISHDLAAVSRLCDRVLLLEDGRIVESGKPADVVTAYVGRSASSVSSGAPADPERKPAEVTGLTFYDQGGRPVAEVRTGESLRVRVAYTAHRPLPAAHFSVLFWSMIDGSLQCQFDTCSGAMLDLSPGPGLVEFMCPSLGLLPGLYEVDAAIGQRDAPDHIEWKRRFATLRVAAGKAIAGRFYAPHEWRLLPPP